MDLTSIIYSSMLVVFSLLSVVLLVSFICSKSLFCGSKKDKQVKNEYESFVSEMELPSMHNSQSLQMATSEQFDFETPMVDEEPITLSIPEVDDELIMQNLVSYNNKPEMLHQEVMHVEYENSFSRYSVVNSYSGNESYFKMSAQYS